VRRARRRRRGRVQARGKRPGSRPDAGEETRRVADAAPRRAAADEAGQTPEPGHLRLGESELRAELAEHRELLLRLRKRGRVRVRGRARPGPRAAAGGGGGGASRPEPLRFSAVSAARRRAGRSAESGAVRFLTARARVRRGLRRIGSRRATLAAGVLVVPLGVFRDGHEQRPPAREPFFRPRLAREQRAELIRGDVRFFQLLRDHDPRARLSRRVFFAEQALDDAGLWRVPVPRRDADELHEKLNRVRVVVPVRAGFERLGAVVVGQKPIELLAFVLLAFVEQTAHTARDLHAE
jgi:hypothetical protein